MEMWMWISHGGPEPEDGRETEGQRDARVRSSSINLHLTGASGPSRYNRAAFALISARDQQVLSPRVHGGDVRDLEQAMEGVHLYLLFWCTRLATLAHET